MKTIASLFKSFPVQLLLINIKQNYLSMFLWTILFGFISQSILLRYGFPFLFLDPEYMGHVGFASFFILGFCLGGFLMTINLSTYINYAGMFPFLGGVRHPFTRFSYNNSILFILFMCYYTVSIVQFQLDNEFQNGAHVALHILGLYTGLALFAGISSFYFYLTNTDIFKLFGITMVGLPAKAIKKVVLGTNMEWKQIRTRSIAWQTTTYFHSPFSIRKTSSIPPFDTDMLNKVITRNQNNAIVIQIVSLIVLGVLGLFSSNEYFQIPAGASLLLLFSAIVMLSGAVAYWLKGWQLFFWLFLILLFSYLNRFQGFDVRSAAYGISYQNPVEYTDERVQALAADSIYSVDSAATINILTSWKKKVAPDGSKPKMILVSTSGGGQRATLFTLRCFQLADSITRGSFFKHTSFISGASGGVLGATYFRELYLRQSLGQQVPSAQKALTDIAQDALNPIALNLAVTDIFIPFQTVVTGKKTYHKDRAYALEKALNYNTNGILDKPISAYHQAEISGQIPMIIYSPSIINDGRRLLISPQNVAYLTRSASSERDRHPIIDGIEFSRFFDKNEPDSLLLTSAIRMSASFPYITPTTCLPSNPLMQVIDAGLRDNLGGDLTSRYYQVFKTWIEENTSGVIFVQIRDTPYDVPIGKTASTSVIARMFDPIAGFGNWERFQEYNQENMISVLQRNAKVPVDRLVFQYVNDDSKKEEASISWHLTSLEKMNVLESLNHPENLQSFQSLQSLLH